MAAIDGDLELEILCLKREVSMREFVYPKWVANGKISQAKADQELRLMRAALARIEGLRPKDLLGG